MPTSATQGQSSMQQQAPPQQAGGIVPFVRASGWHTELVTQQSVTLSASQQQLQPISIPAYGYLRALYILVKTTTAGAGSAAFTTVEDGPFSALQSITLNTPNGNVPLHNYSSGYSLAMVQKYLIEGSTRWDPRNTSAYSYILGGSSEAPSFGFSLKMPLEIDLRSALGSLANKNQTANFRLNLTVGSMSQVYGGGGTISTYPTIEITIYAEEWDQPPAEVNGIAAQLTPPAKDTTMFFTEAQYDVPSGAAAPILNARMGNDVRALLFINRRSGGSRANGDSDWPDPIQVMVDQRNIHLLAKNKWLDDIQQRWGYSSLGTVDTADVRDNGVYPTPWYATDFSGAFGNEQRNLYLSTLEGTRYQLQGTWGNTDTLTVITNDVVPVGQIVGF